MLTRDEWIAAEQGAATPAPETHDDDLLPMADIG